MPSAANRKKQNKIFLETRTASSIIRAKQAILPQTLVICRERS